MSLRIPCPYCGERPVNEFIYGEIPQVPDDITEPEARDFDFAFMRNNPEGIQHEAWFHVYGCRRWTYLHRDTVKDEVVKEDLE